VFILLALFLATIILAFIPGAGIIAIVPAIILVAYIAWLLFGFATGNRPDRAVRQTQPGPDLERDSSDDPAPDMRS